MVKGAKLACIDSCVIISLLKEGKDRPNKSDIPILKGLLAELHAGKIDIIFPTLLRVELLECNLGKALIEQFDQWTALPNFDEVAVNSKISKTASEIDYIEKFPNLLWQTAFMLQQQSNMNARCFTPMTEIGSHQANQDSFYP